MAKLTFDILTCEIDCRHCRKVFTDFGYCSCGHSGVLWEDASNQIHFRSVNITIPEEEGEIWFPPSSK